MARFLALTSKGLQSVLHQEMTQISLQNLRPEGVGVNFQSSWLDMAKAQWRLRTATRVLLPLIEFVAYNQDDLYHGTQRHQFTKYIEPNQTFAIEAHVQRHRELRDQRFVAMKVKDAIADQFRAEFGRRPDVDVRQPAMRVVVRVNGTKIDLALDLSGESLSYRGYRTQSGEAPLREHLAAGLIRIMDWQPEQILVDPMCGSGTFLIEAALMSARQLAPTRRRTFLYEQLAHIPRGLSEQARQELLAQPKTIPKLKLFGYDRDPKMIAMAQANAERAGVANLIQFQVSDIAQLVAPASELTTSDSDQPKGLLVVNPPYAHRLENSSLLASTYEQIATTWKQQFAGWTCWLLSGNEELSQHLHLKAARRVPVYNGNIECRFLRYDIH